MEGVIGFTTLFAGNFAPQGWALCQGQILAISSNTALFSILGTTYGGNGLNTFGLPDLRGRAAIGAGEGNGLSPYTLGELNGTETATLNINQMPVHSHSANVTITPVAATTTSVPSPQNAVYGAGSESLYNPSADASFHSYTGTLTTGATGGSQPFSILNPLLCLNYIICISGVYPARN